MNTAYKILSISVYFILHTFFLYKGITKC